MHIHFIAIGGAVMHNLAIALHKKGYRISGSDDEIFDPSRSRLEKYGLLPQKWGWFPERIDKTTDAVILGMHARKDNPELKKALREGIKIYSFPEYLYEQTQNKKRVVIAGSHGKTTITSMIMHVLRDQGINFDYMVGSQLEGFETMVGFHEDSEIAIFEGDEYLSSPLDPSPKFAHYKPHITLITGIAWDHMNVFPEYEMYKSQFADLILMTDPGGTIFYYEGDEELYDLIRETNFRANALPYYAIPYKITPSGTEIIHKGITLKSRLIGKYNIENLSGALKVCQAIGIESDEFMKSMQSFMGAAKRQELLYENDKIRVFLDFAHAPSKVRATVKGFRENYADKKLFVFLELHTFSSLNKEFIPLYKNSLDPADEAVVFFNPEVVKHKGLPEIQPSFVYDCFERRDLKVMTDAMDLETEMKMKIEEDNAVVLIMSSGNLGGIELKKLSKT
jgi:UDP-N-acetylmuramate: L-alanyl-gamma-D-glutamyl-meso-diaminopimelate ligase